MNDLKPSAIAMLAGGALLALGSILNWGPETSGLSTDAGGLQGLICLVAGLVVLGVVAARNFAGNDIQLNILGFSTSDILLLLGITAFLITFGFQFADGVKFGVTLAWIGAAAIIVGTFLDNREGGSSAPSSAPPTPF